MTPAPELEIPPLSDEARQRAMPEVELRCARELVALYDVLAALTHAADEAEGLGSALERVLDLLQLQGGRISLLDGGGGGARLVVTRGDPALLEPDASHPCLSIPLAAGGRNLGVMQLAGTRAAGFSEAETALARAVGAQISMAVENRRLSEEVRRAESLSALVQEMHHRIKNNLQTVADLLSLEMSASPSPAARKSLRDSITRIKSIAAVHELLSLEQLRLTDITELARQVCDISLRHLVHPNRHVSADITGPAIYLPSKQATALALVMNELIANALEHAFSLQARDGHLTITTEQDGALVTVAIEDNGRGLPAGFELGARRGLGLQIVQTLVEKDLAGTLRLENRAEGGSRATLTFYK